MSTKARGRTNATADSTTDCANPGRDGPAISMEGVKREYPGAAPTVALDGLNLQIDHGEFIAITGPSGSGKSTLLNLIGLLDRPTAGTYALLGQVTDTMSRAERTALRARHFGFVFQRFHLIEARTARQNVELGMLYGHRRNAAEIRHRAMAALANVGLGERADHRARDLSGGERQRVALARAMVADPTVLIADEPTGNLDSNSGSKVMDLIHRLHQLGTTVILVTHEATVAEQAGRRIVIADGVVQEATDISVREVSREQLGPGSESLPESAITGDRHTTRWRVVLCEAILSLQDARRRSVALAVAVGLAVALLIAVLGLGETIRSQVSDRFDAQASTDVTLVDTNATDTGSTSELQAAVRMTDALDAVAGIESAGILLESEGVSVQAGSSRAETPAVLVGVADDALGVAHAQIEWAYDAHPSIGRGDALLGRNIADQLELPPIETLPVVLVNHRPTRIVGLITDTRRALHLLSSVVVDAADTDRFVPNVGATILIRTSPGAAQQVGVRAPIAVDPTSDSRFSVDVPPEAASLRENVEDDVRSITLVLVAVVFLVSLVAMTNSLRSSVHERASEIGLRRALGARRRDIAAQIVTEASLIGIGGGIVGLYVGVLALLVVTASNGWLPVLDLRLIPVAIGAGLVAGTVGGLAATRAATRVEPVSALQS